MQIKQLYSYFSGYVNIIVEGYYIERFINKCASENIYLWNMKRDGECILYTNVSTEDFKRLKNIAKVTKCKLKISRKRGIPFKANKYRKRKLFFILPLIILVFLFVISKFVWNIEVIGNDINKDEILSITSNNGLKTGILKSKVDKDKIINQIRLNRSDISWCGIKIEGTNVVIEIEKAREKPDIVDKNDYCDIVSSRDAIIESIEVTSGTAAVEKGDVVKKGDTLVYGIIEGKYTDSRKVHSLANIKAKVWYSESKKEYKEQRIEKSTGKEENYYQISLNNFKINFNKRVSKFQNYDTIKNSNRLRIFNNFYLPIEITKFTNIEKKEEKINYSEEELKKKIVDDLKNKLKNKIKDKEIIDENVIVEDKNSILKVKVIYEVIEDIGIEQKIN